MKIRLDCQRFRPWASQSDICCPLSRFHRLCLDHNIFLIIFLITSGFELHLFCYIFIWQRFYWPFSQICRFVTCASNYLFRLLVVHLLGNRLNTYFTNCPYRFYKLKTSYLLVQDSWKVWQISLDAIWDGTLLNLCSFIFGN